MTFFKKSSKSRFIFSSKSFSPKALAGALVLISGQALAGFPVDINSASVAELADALDGVGMSKAQAIVEYREEFGPFMEPSELIAVRGIGAATLEKNREYIRLTSEPDLVSSD